MAFTSLLSLGRGVGGNTSRFALIPTDDVGFTALTPKNCIPYLALQILGRTYIRGPGWTGNGIAGKRRIRGRNIRPRCVEGARRGGNDGTRTRSGQAHVN